MGRRRPQTTKTRAKSGARMLLLCAAVVPALAEAGPPRPEAPFRVVEGLFDSGAPGLGLETVPGEQVTIWRGAEESHRFSHHPNLVVWGGALHLIWSNGRVHEDSPGQRIQYSRSDDGLEWSTPRTLADDRDGDGICVAGIKAATECTECTIAGIGFGCPTAAPTPAPPSPEPSPVPPSPEPTDEPTPVPTAEPGTAGTALPVKPCRPIGLSPPTRSPCPASGGRTCGERTRRSSDTS